jgi:hypothetical protein
MGIKFNPFSGNLDLVDSPSGDFTDLDVSGDITLDDGGTYTTTVQTVTPTADRTISFPDATGTVALVAGSSGQLTYNNAGAQAGLTSANIGSTGEINISLAGAASTPPVSFTGSWFTGGTATTTKPQLLIEPSGTTSTAWSTSGTGLGINAASGFAGNLLDLQVNGTSVTRVLSDGKLLAGDGNGSTVAGFRFASQPDIGMFLQTTNLGAGSNTLSFRDNSTGICLASSIGILRVSSNFGFGWASGSANATDPDLTLYRDAAGILAQRNGTNAQTFRVYNTYTDASNYERGFLKWNSNVFEIGAEGAGTGSEQPVRITAATLKLPNLPTYADNAAATTGGLVAGDVYKTATGELRITV